MAIIITATENLPYEDWLDFRRQGIGGSDASVVCGINRWKSPIELWMEKTGQAPDHEAGEPAYWGQQLESLVKAEFVKRTGIEVIPVHQLLQCEDHSFMLANLDGMCEHPIYGPCIFEAKTSSAYRTGEWEDAIPDEYVLQVQHYMSVTGYKGAYVAVLIGGNRFKWYFVERDDDLIEKLIQLESDFWQGVVDGIPPPLDGSEASAKFISERFPGSVPLSKIDLPIEAADLIRQYDSANEKVDLYTEQKQEAENLLKQMMGDNEAGAVGDRIITWKSITSERLDSKTLKAEHPTLYKKYSNKSSYRRFSIKTAS
jgi:putative phage-type endonuclease